MDTITIYILLTPLVSNTCKEVNCLKSIFFLETDIIDLCNGTTTLIDVIYITAADYRDMIIFYLLSLFIPVCVKQSFPVRFSNWIVDFNFVCYFSYLA